MLVEARVKRAAFRELHRKGCFVLPNPWDAGGVRRLEQLGFQALATTSAGCAWALGKEDGQLALAEVLEHFRHLSAAATIPLNADFEAGFARAPGDVAANVLLAVETGVAGLSIEDRDGDALFPLRLSTERIEACRLALDRVGGDVMLVARTEGFLIGQRDLAATLERLVAYAAAGADCLYAPGVYEPAAIGAIVAAVAPKPVNVLLPARGMQVADIAALGVRRVSVGSALARAAWHAFTVSARQLRDGGSLPEIGVMTP